MADLERKRRSIRLQNYDYSNPGAYFVTICTHKRRCLFGEISGSEVLLNSLGLIVEKLWCEIPGHYPSVDLDEFIVMPNHFHGILVIDRFLTGEACLAPTKDQQKIGLAHVVGSFKSAASKMVNDLNGRRGSPIWQRNYYEHVIRDEGDLNKIREYIADNPLQWALDEENPERLQLGGSQTRPYDEIDKSKRIHHDHQNPLSPQP